MPNYSYSCEKCGTNFELFFLIKDYVAQPKCIICSSKKTTRNYVADAVTQSSSVKKSDSELKTLGDLANRNRDRMSSDQIESLNQKHNNYKEPNDKPLPSGMNRIKRPPKTIWPGSTPKVKQRRKRI